MWGGLAKSHMTEPINTTVAAVSLVTLAAAIFGPTAGPYIVLTLGSICHIHRSRRADVSGETLASVAPLAIGAD